MSALNIGEFAPDFTAKNQRGADISLRDFKGKKVILYFYPKDDTPGCTAESCNLRDNYDTFLKQGYEVIGVSNDDVDSHKKFAEKYDLPYNLIADTDKSIVEKYGVYGEKNTFGKKHMGINRTTFIINGDGMIEKIINKVDTKNHSEQILA
ncbi:MAG: thioredoxin-dependent thiol peroxidase [Sphingobacteriales bacterium]|nr:MAG: thioredoxin-dependent thiol peroxidase [Sphingobacteriales bacterium]